MELDLLISAQIAASLILLTAIAYIISYLNTPKNLPPGPWGLPLLGYALFLGKKPHETINELKKKYGDIIRLKLGREAFIFLNSYKAVKEALVKQSDIFSARPIHHYPPQLRSTPGLIGSNDEMWAELRRFTLSKLRDFGLGKSSLELQMKDEISHFIKEVALHKNKQIINFHDIIHKSIFNIICVFMTGQRYEYSDQKFCTLLELVTSHMKRIGVGRLEDYFPTTPISLRIMKFLGIEHAMETHVQLNDFITTTVDEFDQKCQNENHLIDAWLAEARDANSKYKYLTKNQLPITIIDLFLAGSDTTTNTLSWGLLYMMKHPEVQIKVQQEIDNVIGRERTPSMTDQKLMPYTEAIIMEINRIVTIAPLALEHMATKDTSLEGYFIPKGTPTIINLWAIHHDPEIFKDPEEFKPERFLTENGEVKRMEEYIPFSLGKRQCMGESLARMEQFLYFTSMLQQFTFEKVEGNEIDFDYHYSVVSIPNPQPIRVIGR